MLRRDFLQHASRAAAGALLASGAAAKRLAAIPELPRKFSASETVALGHTGILTSRLAMGTGTVGSGKHSHQTALGIDGLSRLLLNGYDNGLRFFDTADTYGSHPHVAEALKHVDRSKVFRKELGTDHLDIVLMHCMTEGDWTTHYEPVRDVLSEAKQKGIIRAHGCSCHSIEALRAAAKSPWVDVDLARVNPVGAFMDAEPDTVVSVLRAMKSSGKAVIGMKILGQGMLRNRQDEALRFALGLGILDAFTIGAESIAEQNDVTKRIAAA